MEQTLRQVLGMSVNELLSVIFTWLLFSSAPLVML